MFLNNENMLMAYNYRTKREAFNMTMCHFPGSKGKIDLGTIIEQNGILIG